MKKHLLILFWLILCLNKFYTQTNWELLNPKPTANTGKDLEFVSASMGYIITSNELLETIDSGTSWQKKQDISSGKDMSFNNSNGYIVGNNGYVLKSEDNGASWTEISTGFNASFNTVNIIDANSIILSSANSIVKSNNGGITWLSSIIPNETVNRTFFTSSFVGHAVCNDGTILKTIDGGENWYITQSTTLIPSGYFTVYFIDQSIGFATQEFDNMYKTTDGGETWVEVSGTNHAVFDLYFINESDGFVTGESGSTYKTTDGGLTWTPIFFQTGFIGNTSMYGIYFENSNVGYITGARGRIAKTNDGGVSWTEHSATYGNINRIQIFESGIGYVQIGTSYFKTNDNGNNWSFIATVDHFTSCIGFYFISENIGYSIGGGSSSISGDIFKTIDGGITWNQLDIYVDEGLSSVFFLDEDIGFISGGFNQRKVLKTEDGGDTWEEVLDEEFGQIQFIDSLIGYAHRIGYSDGRMYKTTDGGNSWNISIEVDEDINAFDFVDENIGYFVGDQGLIYKTYNGGTDWQELDLPYGWYETVKFHSEDIGYVGDDDGEIYKTTNGGLNWESLTTQYGLNSIDLVNEFIFTAGSNGKIYRGGTETVSITDYLPKQHISVYPNPSNNFLNVKVENYDTIRSIEIYNSNGKLMTHKNIMNFSNVVRLDISNFGIGIFLLKINYKNNATISSKIVLN